MMRKPDFDRIVRELLDLRKSDDPVLLGPHISEFGAICFNAGLERAACHMMEMVCGWHPEEREAIEQLAKAIRAEKSQ